MRTVPKYWVRLAAAAMAMGTPALAPGEMIVLQTGSVQMGRIESEDTQTVQFLTGDVAGRTETRISRVDVRQVYRGPDEQEQIRDCSDPARLADWAAAYFQAGLDDLGELCLRRAIELDPLLGAEPRRTGSMSFLMFWNRAAFELRAASLKDGDGPALLDAAIWAYQAALNREAAAYLRRAHSADSASPKISALAKGWGVHLDPWIRLDLTTALDTQLLADPIPDEGQEIPARPDMIFLTLPLRYEVNPGAHTLTKDSFTGSDMQDWYGFRPLPTKAGRPDLSGVSVAEPVYERLDWRLLQPARSAGPSSLTKGPAREEGADASASQNGKASPPESDTGGRVELAGKNTSGPRRIDTAEITRLEPKTRLKFLPLTGWIALVVEVLKPSKRVTIGWMDGVQEDVDLDFLRLAAKKTEELLQADAGPALAQAAPPPGVAQLLTKVWSPSAATVSLAIKRLARLAAEVGLGEEPAWMSGVDQEIFTAAMDGDEEVRSMAWSYFSSRRGIPESTAAFLAHRPACAQRDWIAIIKKALKNMPADMGPAAQPRTTQPAGPGSSDASAGVKTAVIMLTAMLRSENASVCDEALDVLIGLDDKVDWCLMERASETAQSHLLLRLGEIADRTSAEKVVRIAMKNVRPALAAEIAAQASRLELHLSRPDDPLLTQWSADTLPERQTALLSVLEAVTLGDLCYSRPFAEAIEAAVYDRAAPAVHEAAFRVLIAQARRQRQESLSSRHARSSAGRPPDAVEPGEFPVLLSIKIEDPVIRGLRQAVKAGSQQTRREAVAMLLSLGYGEETVRALEEGMSEPADRVALLRALTEADPEVACCDGLLATLGRMLRDEYASDAPFLISYLETALARRSPQDAGRARAAVRRGIDFTAANALIDKMGLATARPLRALLPKLCHMSPQDEQRYLQAWRNSEQRLQCLARIDLRKGYLVDGRYEAWAILETVVSEAPATPDPPAASQPEPRHWRWTAPRRMTIALPTLDLESDESQKSYRVLWGGRSIGQGTVRTIEGIRSASAYSRRLENPPEELLGRDGWGWPAPLNTMRMLSQAVGPAVLAEGGGGTHPAAGTMLLDATEYLRTALRDQQVFGTEDLNHLVPPEYRLVLRYGAFGSFYGVAQRPRLMPGQIRWQGSNQSEPYPVDVGEHCLLNVMLILELRE